MKEIMFLGDSLTAGSIGSSYLKILEEEQSLKGIKLINAGENGFTMAGLQKKLETYLNHNKAPDTLLIEGGANDLLLPHMQQAGSDWDPFIRKLKRHASVPASSAAEFRTNCSIVLDTALDAGIGQLFFCTIPFLGENLSSRLNIQREQYNRSIRELCTEYSNDTFSCLCIDAALEAEPLLKGKRSNWLFSTAEELQNDALTIQEKGEDFLCRERDLLLTIDGAHLNRKGAEFFSSLLLKAFKENSVLL